MRRLTPMTALTALFAIASVYAKVKYGFFGGR